MLAVTPASSSPDATARQLPLLQGVSRSFYLSIRLLPQDLRQPIALAYLLARASDTVADTADLPPQRRLALLELLALAVEGYGTARAALPGLAAGFAPLQQDAAEQRLVLALPQCVQALDGLEPADRADVRAVLRKIVLGQILDVERFGAGGPVRALATSQELEDYTYLVAGCVGEFWTALCFRHLPDFADQPQAQMAQLGRDYGMGLQLVNILRDLRADLGAGRCYLPLDQLRGVGITPAELLRSGDRAEPVLQAWRALAGTRMQAGMRYALAVDSRRVRAASALPALLGVRTLDLLRQAGPLGGRVKMPRTEVQAVLLRLALGLGGRGTLRAQYRRLRGQADGTIAA